MGKVSMGKRSRLMVERIGETRENLDGVKMTICAYRKFSDIDVVFEGGFLKEHVKYGNFKRGSVGTPTELIEQLADGGQKIFEARAKTAKIKANRGVRTRKGKKYHLDKDDEEKKVVHKETDDIPDNYVKVYNWTVGTMSHSLRVLGNFSRGKDGKVTCMCKCLNCKTVMRYSLAKAACRDARCRVCNID